MALPSFRAARNLPLPSYRSRAQTDPSSKHRGVTGASSASTEVVEPPEDAGDTEDAQELHAVSSATIAVAERPPEQKGTGKGGGGNKQQTQSQRARQLAKKRAALSTAVLV